MTEAETRAEHIDPALKVAGWGVARARNYAGERAVRVLALKATLSECIVKT